MAAERLSGYYKRIKAERHVCRDALRYMEHNNVDNHIYFKVHAGNVLHVYSMKQHHIIRPGDILGEIKDIDDDDEPKKSIEK